MKQRTPRETLGGKIVAEQIAKAVLREIAEIERRRAQLARIRAVLAFDNEGLPSRQLKSGSTSQRFAVASCCSAIAITATA
jgi:hypothetical protein